jgi:hypothetical protein
VQHVTFDFTLVKWVDDDDDDDDLFLCVCACMLVGWSESRIRVACRIIWEWCCRAPQLTDEDSLLLQMLASGFMILVIGLYVVSGTVMMEGDSLPMLGAAFTLFSMIIIFLLTVSLCFVPPKRVRASPRNGQLL